MTSRAAAVAPAWADSWAVVPPALRPWLLPFEWDRERLWALELPVRALAVEELAWQLELPWWRSGERFFAVRPTDVLAGGGRHAAHRARALAADPAAPLDLTPRGGRLVLLDGVHRLLAAVLTGRATVPARVLPAERLLEIAVPGGVAHDLELVRAVVRLLGGAGVTSCVYGGWARELLGLEPPRPHRDVDLLHRAESFAAVDRALRALQLHEVAAKRFAHKRAFELAGVLVEVLLVRTDSRGAYTLYGGTERHDWPAPLAWQRHGLPVARPEVLATQISRTRRGAVARVPDPPPSDV